MWFSQIISKSMWNSNKQSKFTCFYAWSILDHPKPQALGVKVGSNWGSSTQEAVMGGKGLFIIYKNTHACPTWSCRATSWASFSCTCMHMLVYEGGGWVCPPHPSSTAPPPLPTLTHQTPSSPPPTPQTPNPETPNLSAPHTPHWHTPKTPAPPSTPSHPSQAQHSCRWG